MDKNLKYDPDIHHRRSIRLKGYDYAQAALYFITICTANKLCIFGEIHNDEMILNEVGKMVDQQWIELIHRFDNIKLHEYIVMPNHFHGIVEFLETPLVGDQNVNQSSEIIPTVGDVVGAFKSLTTNDYIRNVKQNNWKHFDKKLWQRNFFEHIIRNEKSYCQISEYIQTNQFKWQDDKYFKKITQI